MLSYFSELLKSYLVSENKDIPWNEFRKPSAYKNVNTSGYIR